MSSLTPRTNRIWNSSPTFPPNADQGMVKPLSTCAPFEPDCEVSTFVPEKAIQSLGIALVDESSGGNTLRSVGGTWFFVSQYCSGMPCHSPQPVPVVSRRN